MRFLKDYWFIGLGVLLQLYAWSPEMSWLSLVSGVSGVIAVVLCSQRKYSQFIFSFTQLFSYVYLCWEQRLWGEIGENMFYLVTMLIALGTWQKKDEEGRVEAKTLSPKASLLVFLGMILGVEVTWKILRDTTDTQPFLDSLTTVPAFIAQVLLVFRYQEQWIYWGIIDVGSIWMWTEAGNPCMVAQFIFWTLNCLYGYTQWKKENYMN